MADIRALITELKEILASEKKLKGCDYHELREIQKDYADARRTEIVENVEEIKLEDLIADVDMAITVSHAGYIKRTPNKTLPPPVARRQGDASARKRAMRISSNICSSRLRAQHPAFQLEVSHQMAQGV